MITLNLTYSELVSFLLGTFHGVVNRIDILELSAEPRKFGVIAMLEVNPAQQELDRGGAPGPQRKKRHRRCRPLGDHLLLSSYYSIQKTMITLDLAFSEFMSFPTRYITTTNFLQWKGFLYQS